MKITVKKEDFAAGLKKVLSAVSSRTTLPVLNNVLLEASGVELVMTTTDLEVSISSSIPATIHEEGETTLPAKKLGQIVNALPTGEVTLETQDNRISTVSCQKSFFRIVGLDANEFPRETFHEETWSFTVPCNEFRKHLCQVFYSSSTDETRQVLNGVLLSVREGILTTAATDGRRLALVEKSLEQDELVDGDVILPPKAVSELQRNLEHSGDVTLHLSDSKAKFTFGTTVITTKLVEGTYPNYRLVIPQSFEQSASIPREQFSEVLNRVSMVLSESSSSISLDLKEAFMIVQANSSEIGEGSESMEISYDGAPVNISFNPGFLAEPLKYLESDQLIIQFNDEYSPISLSGDEGFLYVIMPMRNN